MTVRTFFAAAAAVIVGLSTAAAGAEELRVAATPVPHADILKLIEPDLQKDGYDLKIVEFSDYGHLNEALSTGDIDCNAFQHKPFLDKAAATKGYKFTALGKTVIFPIGVYSAKIRRKEDITDGMLVSVPADAVNLGRGLQHYQTAPGHRNSRGTDRHHRKSQAPGLSRGGQRIPRTFTA